MKYCFRQSGHLGLLTFMGDLTGDRIEELSEAIMTSLKNIEHLVVSFERKGRLSLRYIQVLCAWHRRCQRKNKRMTIINSPLDHKCPAIKNIMIDLPSFCLPVCKQPCLWAE